MGNLQLITGYAGSGKTTHILERIVNTLTKEPDRRIILLVPEQASYNYEYQLTIHPAIGGILSVQVLSFQRLAWTVLQQTGGAAQTVLSDLGKLLILRQEILRADSDLAFLKGSANKPGYLQLLAEAIAEFKQYGYSPEDLAENIKANPSDGALLDLKLSDLQRLYASYSQRLTEDHIDSEDMMKLLLRKLPQWQELRQTDIYIDSFDSFTPQEMAVVDKLIALAPSVTVALTLPVGASKTSFLQKQVFANTIRTADQLKLAIQQAEGTLLEDEVLLGSYRYQAHPDLTYLVKQYHTLLTKPYPQVPAALHLIEAQNLTAEVEYTAREIRRLCREEGYHYSDIAVFMRDLTDYETLLQNTFDDLSIPYFLDMRQSILHHPLLELILAALEIKQERWSYPAVFRYLKSDLAVLTHEEVDELENYVLAFGIKGSYWLDAEPWRFQKRYTLEEEQKALWTEEDLERINAYRRQVVQPLNAFHRRLENSQNTSEMVINLYQLLEELAVPQKLQQWAERSAAEGDLAQAEIHEQIWSKMLDVLDQLVLIAGKDALSTVDFYQLLQAGFRQIDLGMIPTNLDQVQIGILQRSRSQSLKAVFLLGVNEGLFPARMDKSGLFTDTERSLLEERSLALAPGEREQLAAEEYLVYIALTRASDYLSCSYALSDNDGKSRRPSMIIRRLRTLFPEAALQEVEWPPKEAGAALFDYIDHPLRALSLVGSGLQRAQSPDEQAIWSAVYDHLRLSEYAEALKRSLNSAFYDRQPPALPPELTAKLYPAAFRLSVSSIEKYRQCPYAHFLTYGLRLKERLTYELESFDIGQFYHKAMELLNHYLQEQQLQLADLTEDKVQIVVSQIVEQLAPTLQNEILLSSSRYQYIKRKLGLTLEQSVKLMALHGQRGVFQPLGVEVAFGANAKVPGLKLQLDENRSVELIGRIDRVEQALTEAECYLRIIDFKTGSKGLTLSEIFYGLKIQLLVYMDIIMFYCQKLEEKRIIRPAGVFYYFFKNPIIKSDKPLSLEVIQQEIMAEMVPQGLVLADLQGLLLADRQLGIGKSTLLPLSLKKNAAPYLSGEKLAADDEELLDIFDRRSSAVVTPQQMALLQRYVIQLIRRTGQEMLGGNIAISPCRLKTFDSCQYCTYRAICHFEPQEAGSYRELQMLDSDVIWQSIEKQVMNHE